MLVFTTLTQPDDTKEVATVLTQLCQFRDAKDAPIVLSKWYDLMVNPESSYNSSLLVTKTVHSGDDGWWFDVWHDKKTYHVFIKRQLVSSCFYHTNDGSNLNLPPYEIRRNYKKSKVSEVITTVFEGKVTSSKATWEWNPGCCQWKHTPGTPESARKHKAYRAASKASSVCSSSRTRNTDVSAASKSSRASIPTTVDDPQSDKAPSEPLGKTAQPSSTHSEPTSSRTDKKVMFKDGHPPVPEALLDTLDTPTNQYKKGPRHRNASDDVSFRLPKVQENTQDSLRPGRRRHKSGDPPRQVSLQQDPKTQTLSRHTGEAPQVSQQQQLHPTSGSKDDCSRDPPVQEDPLHQRPASKSEDEGEEWQTKGGRKQRKK